MSDKKHAYEHKSLHSFSSQHICDVIRNWVENHIIYKNNLSQMIEIFTTDDAKLLVQNDLTKFMTTDTQNIIFKYFDEWKKKQPKIVQTKSSEQIANILT